MVSTSVEAKSIHSVIRSEPVSAPPVFDVAKAVRAQGFVESRYGQVLHDFSALRIALTLSLYNSLGDFTTNGSGQHSQRLLTRLSRLIATEKSAADPNNLLPTIGFEVETPRKIFKPETDVDKYDRFFAHIGMPRNRAIWESWEGGKVPTYWEFSPPPSYSAAVQMRILAELIKGDFIPHLTSSQNPDDIRIFLDNKLVALHLNLGMPTELARKMVFSDSRREFELFAGLFALAFTSPQRLRSTVHASLFKRKDPAEPTKKNRTIPLRFEIKALEVGNESTYRLIQEMQRVGAALFAYLEDTHPLLKEQWSKLRREALLLLDKYHTDPSLLTTDRVWVADILQETDMASKLRPIIAQGARDIKRVLG